jgi:hypothetical protein
MIVSYQEYSIVTSTTLTTTTSATTCTASRDIEGVFVYVKKVSLQADYFQQAASNQDCQDKIAMAREK